LVHALSSLRIQTRGRGIAAGPLDADSHLAGMVPVLQNDAREKLAAAVLRIAEGIPKLKDLGIDLQELSDYLAGVSDKKITVSVSGKDYPSENEQRALMDYVLGKESPLRELIVGIVAKFGKELIPEEYLKLLYKKDDFNEGGTGLTPEPGNMYSFDLERTVSPEEIERRITSSDAIMKKLGIGNAAALTPAKPQTPSTYDAGLSVDDEIILSDEAMRYANSFVSGAYTLLNYSAWQDLRAFISAAESCESAMPLLANNLQYLTPKNRKAVEMAMNKLAKAGFINSGGADLVAEDLAKSEYSPKSFASEVARQMQALNALDRAAHDFVFSGSYSPSIITSQSNLISGKSGDYAIRAIYGNLDTALQILSKIFSPQGNGNSYIDSTGWGEKSPSARLSYVYSLISQHPENFERAYDAAQSHNKDAAIALIDSKKIHITPKEGDDFSSSVWPQLRTVDILTQRNPYNMLETAAGLAMLSDSEAAPFIDININAGGDLQTSTELAIGLLADIEQMKISIYGAPPKSPAEFKKEFDPLLEIFDANYKLILAARGMDDPAVKTLTAAWNSFGNSTDIYDLANDPAQSDLLARKIGSLEAAFGQIANSAYGANPLLQMLKAGASPNSMPVGAMLEILSSDAWKKVFPDSSMLDLGTRSNIMLRVLGDAAQVYKSNSPSNRHEQLMKYLGAVSSLELNMDVLMSDMVQKFFRETEGGVLKVVVPLENYAPRLYLGGDISPESIFAQLWGHPMYGLNSPIIPLKSTGAFPYDSDVGWRLQSLRADNQRFVRGQWGPVTVREYLLRPVSEYRADETRAYDLLAGVLRDYMGKPDAMGGPWNARLGYAHTEALEKTDGGTFSYRSNPAPGSYMSVDGNYNAVEGTSYDSDSYQWLGSASNWPNMGDALVRTLQTNGNLRWNEPAGRLALSGTGLKTVDQNEYGYLNSSLYHNSDLVALVRNSYHETARGAKKTLFRDVDLGSVGDDMLKTSQTGQAIGLTSDAKLLSIVEQANGKLYVLGLSNAAKTTLYVNLYNDGTGQVSSSDGSIPVRTFSFNPTDGEVFSSTGTIGSEVQDTYVKVYNRIYGTLWTRAIYTKDSAVYNDILKATNAASRDVDDVQNYLVSGGTPVSNIVQVRAAYEHAKVNRAQKNAPILEKGYDGWMVGVTFGNTVGAIAAQTIDQERAEGVQVQVAGQKYPTFSTTISHFRILDSRLRSYGGSLYAYDYGNEYLRRGWQSRENEPKTDLGQFEIGSHIGFAQSDYFKAMVLSSLNQDYGPEFGKTSRAGKDTWLAANAGYTSSLPMGSQADYIFNAYTLLHFAPQKNPDGTVALDAYGAPKQIFQSGFSGIEGKIGKDFTSIYQNQKYDTGNVRHSGAVRANSGDWKWELSGSIYKYPFYRFNSGVSSLTTGVQNLATQAQKYTDLVADKQLFLDHRRENYLNQQQGQLSYAANSLFTYYDMGYSLLWNLGAGRISDLSFKGQQKDGSSFSLGFSNVQRAEGKGYVLAGFADISRSVAVALRTETTDKFWSDYKVSGGGVMINGPKRPGDGPLWKVAAYASRIDVPTAQAAFQNSVLYPMGGNASKLGFAARVGFDDAMLEITRAEDKLWMLKTGYLGKNFQIFGDFTEIDKAYRKFGLMSGAYFGREWKLLFEATYDTFEQWHRVYANAELTKYAFFSDSFSMGGGFSMERKWWGQTGQSANSWTVYLKAGTSLW